MAMKELMKIALDAKQVREACEAFVQRRIDTTTEVAHAEAPEELQIMVTVTKKRAPKKPKAGSAAA